MKDYKKILEGVVNIINTTEKSDIGFANICTYIGEKCPELKESEDEKIRKALVRFHKSTIDIDGIKGADILAWLEKQSKSSDQIHYWTEEEIEPIINDYLRGAEHYGGMIGRLRCLKPKSLEKQGSSSVKWQKNTPDNKPAINHSVLMKTIQGIAEGEWQGEYWFQYRWSWTLKDSDVLAWMELSDLNEQGEQKSVLDFKASNWYVSKVDGKIHDITYNSTDKVEPKFKVGDFIVNDYCMGKVVEITNDAYLLDTEQGIPFSCENNVHLWTIADAKEGNILAGKIDGDNYILIFKTIKDGWIETYGHYYNAVNRFCVPSQLFCRSYQGTFTPATEEQRDTLIKAMTDAGYEWNAEKKELKLLITNGGDFEQKPKTEWSEDDEHNLNGIVDEIRANQNEGPSCDIKTYNRFIDWLKSLKDRVQPQPKQEWSEEDDAYKIFAISAVEDYYDEENPLQKAIVDWLKSLKDKIKEK